MDGSLEFKKGKNKKSYVYLIGKELKTDRIPYLSLKALERQESLEAYEKRNRQGRIGIGKEE